MIAVQYARRRTALARSLILALMAALVLISVAAPYRKLINRQYPPLKTGEQPPFQLRLGRNSGTWQGGRIADPKEIGITLPLTILRAAPDSIVVMQGFQVELEDPNGLTWISDWTSMNEMNLLPGGNFFSVSFAMPRSLYDQLVNSALKVRVSLAFTFYKDANRRPFVVPPGNFTLPDAGLCSATPIEPSMPLSFFPMVACLAPLHRPTSLFLTLKLTESTCPLPQGQPSVPPESIGRGWIHSSESPAEFGIDPVSQFDLAPFTYSYVPPYPKGSVPPRPGICPGTPLILSSPQKVGDAQLAQQFEGFHLPTHPTNVSFELHRGFE